MADEKVVKGVAPKVKVSSTAVAGAPQLSVYGIDCKAQWS